MSDEVKLGRRGRRGRRTNAYQTDAYWERLRQEFQAGVHSNSGAYCASAHPSSGRQLLEEGACASKS